MFLFPAVGKRGKSGCDALGFFRDPFKKFSGAVLFFRIFRLVTFLRRFALFNTRGSFRLFSGLYESVRNINVYLRYGFYVVVIIVVLKLYILHARIIQYQPEGLHYAHYDHGKDRALYHPIYRRAKL